MSKTVKVLQNDQGQYVFTLPASGVQVTLRNPKGKDLKALEAYSAIATKSESPNYDTGCWLVCQLAVEPQYTLAQIDDLEGEDITALMSVVNTFPAIRALRG